MRHLAFAAIRALVLPPKRWPTGVDGQLVHKLDPRSFRPCGVVHFHAHAWICVERTKAEAELAWLGRTRFEDWRTAAAREVSEDPRAGLPRLEQLAPGDDVKILGSDPGRRTET